MTVTKVYKLPDGVEDLALSAEQEGYNFLDRLLEEYTSKMNCFDKPGEALFAVHSLSRLIGIGGVNIDPYSSERGVGRVRRFYVHPKERRCGVGQMLLTAIEDDARSHFHKLNLFTDTESAALFYEKLGYVRITGTAKVSHMKGLCIQ